MDQDKFNKAVAYAISKGYFRDPNTPDIDQSTNEGGLITLRTPRGAKVAQFQTDGDTFDGIGNLSTKIAATKSSYICPKCGSTSYETGQIRVSGGVWSSVLDVENKRYDSVSCTECGYTEFYKKTVSRAEKVLDFLADWNRYLVKEPSAVITTRWWVVFRMAWVNSHTLKAAKEAFAQKSYQHSGDIEFTWGETVESFRDSLMTDRNQV